MTSQDLSDRWFAREAQDILQPLNFDEREESLPDDQLAACVDDSTDEFIELLSGVGDGQPLAKAIRETLSGILRLCVVWNPMNAKCAHAIFELTQEIINHFNIGADDPEKIISHNITNLDAFLNARPLDNFKDAAAYLVDESGWTIQGQAGRNYVFAGLYRIGAISEVDMRIPTRALKLGIESSLLDFNDPDDPFLPQLAAFTALQWVIACPLELHSLRLGTQCITPQDNGKIRHAGELVQVGSGNEHLQRQSQHMPLQDCPQYAYLRYEFLKRCLARPAYDMFRPLAAEALGRLRQVEDSWNLIEHEVKEFIELSEQETIPRETIELQKGQLCQVFLDRVDAFVQSDPDAMDSKVLLIRGARLFWRFIVEAFLLQGPEPHIPNQVTSEALTERLIYIATGLSSTNPTSQYHGLMPELAAETNYLRNLTSPNHPAFQNLFHLDMKMTSS